MTARITFEHKVRLLSGTLCVVVDETWREVALVADETCVSIAPHEVGEVVKALKAAERFIRNRQSEAHRAGGEA